MTAWLFVLVTTQMQIIVACAGARYLDRTIRRMLGRVSTIQCRKVVQPDAKGRKGRQMCCRSLARSLSCGANERVRTRDATLNISKLERQCVRGPFFSLTKFLMGRRLNVVELRDHVLALCQLAHHVVVEFDA